MGLGTSQARLLRGRLRRVGLGMVRVVCLVGIRQLNQQQGLLNSPLKRTSGRCPQGVPKPLSGF